MPDRPARRAFFRRAVRLPMSFAVAAALAGAVACMSPGLADRPGAPYIVVLGVAQDGGIPQAGNRSHAAWQEPGLRRLVVSLALVDPVSSERWLFEATPDIREQLHLLDRVAPAGAPAPGLAGIFLTHAHIGHYLGLAQLGHEAMGARDVPVHVTAKFRSFLERNGPWDQLVRYGNVRLRTLQAGQPVRLNDRLTVTAVLVPHRQEYSEVVGFRIDGPTRSAFFLPDIDSWEDWDAMGTRVEQVVADVDVAWLDATFYADGEIPGRDMSGFPHPFITTTMQRFASRDEATRGRIRFIHFNHTNPVARPGSDERRAVQAAGFHVAERGERFEL